jgi:hypothetical protein
MEQNWRDITYLSLGTPRQRSAYADLRSLRVLEVLAEFDPVVASTVCIDIDIPSSDLDIICEVHDPVGFESKLLELFGSMRCFQVRRSDAGSGVVAASFFHGEWEYEVFGQPIPVERQNAYRHMRQTFRVVSLGGEVWRDAIRTLKMRGVKTEPAVALALGLEGDPYEAVLSLETLSNPELVARLTNGPVHGSSA